ncbi:MAG TPA: phosphatidylserine decarboxylase family protein [Chitinophagaceae bacterium]|nr:phosphatidylserine decarboxylase family protein [Chitinophagaceae bacterium]
MNIHKEGYKSIALGALVFGAVNIIFFYFFSASMPVIAWIVFAGSLLGLLFIISFFRSPKRNCTIAHHQVICPADGKVVVIEETVDPEYFHDKRLQVSIFMSPANVHINRIPMSGEVLYSQYHKGKYLVAWNPKSSTENERHSVVIKSDSAIILVKQIAGAVAKRIVNYLQVGQKVEQGTEMGFIKFGSRVDVLLPVGTGLNVTLNQAVKGGMTVLATIDTLVPVEEETLQPVKKSVESF